VKPLDRLNKWQFAGVVVAVVIVVAGMAGGFWSSFSNLYAAAAAAGWKVPALLPLCIDSGILAYVLLDHLAVTLGARSRWLHVIAWALAGFTVWANAVVAPASSTVWRVIYAAMPALWVVGVEALRFFWRLLRTEHEDAPARGRVPAGRWLANPATAALLQRRMWMLNETSWPRMAAIDDARLYARDLVRAAADRGRTGAPVPAMLSSRIRSGRLPGAVLSAIDDALRYGDFSRVEAAVHSWVAAQMTLTERFAADLQTERRTIAKQAAGPARETGLAPRPRAASKRTPDYSRKPSAKAAKAMSGADLAPYVEAWIAGGGRPTCAAVSGAFHVGDPKAREALEAATGSSYAPARAPVAALAPTNGDHHRDE